MNAFPLYPRHAPRPDPAATLTWILGVVTATFLALAL
jgi:hypothetical protein